MIQIPLSDQSDWVFLAFIVWDTFMCLLLLSVAKDVVFNLTFDFQGSILTFIGLVWCLLYDILIHLLDSWVFLVFTVWGNYMWLLLLSIAMVVVFNLSSMDSS